MDNDKYQDDVISSENAAQAKLDQVGESIQNGVDLLNEMLYRQFESKSESRGTEFEARMPAIGSQKNVTGDGVLEVIQMYWLVPHPEDYGMHQLRLDLPVGSCDKQELKNVLPGLLDAEFEYVWHIEKKARLLRELIDSLYETFGLLCSADSYSSKDRLH